MYASRYIQSTTNQETRMTDQDTSALPSVREQREMTAEINERIRKRGECVWVDIEPPHKDNFVTGCGASYFFVNGNITRWEFVYCLYCGKRIEVK